MSLQRPFWPADAGLAEKRWPMMASTLLVKELAERPQGYRGPNLSPRGLRLIPTELATGAYVLVANIPSKDNNGLVIGERAALVIDAGIVPDISV